MCQGSQSFERGHRVQVSYDKHSWCVHMPLCIYVAPTQIYSGEVHRGGGVISQTHVDQDLALQQDGLVPTSGAFDASCREINPESMQCHAKLQSVLQRVMELERRLGVVRDDKSLHRERIQLGLEVSVAGKRGVWASGFPFMMVLLALITVLIPNACKYVFSA